MPVRPATLEVTDNKDGTRSLLGTVIDHGAPVDTPTPGTDARTLTERQLASIARELSYNDPQSGGKGGTGRPQDHDVELLLPDPRER